VGLLLHCHVATHVFLCSAFESIRKTIFIIAYMDLEGGEEYV